MYNCNNDEEIRRIIERDTRRCGRFAVGPTGPRGATGPTGPAGGPTGPTGPQGT